MISFSFIFNVSGSSFDALFGLGGVGGSVVNILLFKFSLNNRQI